LKPSNILLTRSGVKVLDFGLAKITQAPAGAGGASVVETETFILRAYGFEPTPLLLGFVLSQPLEEHFRRAMLFSDNDPTTFLTHPVSATLLALTAILVVLSALPAIHRTRRMLQ
jgi:putative tricarboxylic transport membrane protein